MSTTNHNVILSIGSKMGPGGLASLQAGINMVGSFGSIVKKTITSFDDFERVLKRTNMEVVNYADAAAQGSIDTFELMKTYNKMKYAMDASGVQLTAEAFKILSVRAADFAEHTGRDATETFRQLGDAFAKGRTRVFQEYGLYVKKTEDIADTMRRALSGMTSGFEDVTFAMDTNTKRVIALENNWGTFTAAVFSSIEEFDTVRITLDGVNFVLSEMAVSLTETRDAVDGLNNEYKETSEVLKEVNKEVDDLLLAQEFQRTMGGAMGGWSLGGIGGFEPGFIEAYRERRNKQLGDIDELLGYALEGFGGKQSVFTYTAEAEKEAKKKKAGGGGARRGHRAGDEGLLSYDAGDPVFEYGESLGRDMSSMEDYEAVKSEYESGLADVIPLSGGKSFRAGSTPAEQIVGPFKPGTGPRRSDGDLTIAPESFAVDVDAKLDEMQRLEEQRDLEAVALMERMEEYKQQQAEIYDFETGWQMEQLQFAENYGNTWAATMQQVSAGTLAANASINLMRSSWGAVVDMAIYSQKSIGGAMRAITHEIGKALAKEAGWRAAMEFIHAIAAAASYQYGAMAKHLAAGAGYTALAAGGIAVGRATAPAAPSVGAGGMSEIGAGPQGGGGYNPSYGGGAAGGQERDLNITVRAADGWFEAIVDENDRSYRAGGRAFTEDAA